MWGRTVELPGVPIFPDYPIFLDDNPEIETHNCPEF